MTRTPYDLVVRNGTIGTATDVFRADLAVRDGRIAAIGNDLGEARHEIDARDRLVLPGGVDTHAHVEQLSAGGLMNADSFESATRSAALGGTTTILSFAAQHRGRSLKTVVEDYHRLAARGAVIDYGFHMIVADPTEAVLASELPPLVASGHASIKVFMTYDLLNVGDEKLLDILLAARRLGALVAVHAENHGMISWLSKRLVEKGYTAPKYHAVSHPRGSEAEAFQRLIALAELIDQPIIIYHVSTREGVEVIRQARGRGVRVFAETCPQYLFLTARDLDKPGLDGAKWMCSPPPRDVDDQEVLWRALALGDLQIVSSDHAPYAFDASGKLSAGPTASFKQIANGLPGLQARLPLMFDAIVNRGRGSLSDFVRWTATEPARIYGLAQKGTFAIGADADIAIWDPHKAVTFSDADVTDNTGYTPWQGRSVTGWPVLVLRRGEVVAEAGRMIAMPGSGRFQARVGGAAARPSGRLSPEFDPERNFGADLY
jgi:dihydropyrimidinase